MDSLIRVERPLSQLQLLLLAASFIGFMLHLWRARTKTMPPYPPGPPGHFLLGNVKDMPSAKAWITFANWSKEYDSPIVHANVLGQHIVVINSRKYANELFEKRSHIYSDRPTFPMVELMGWSYNSALLPYGTKWRRHRRLFHQVLKKDAATTYEPVEAKKIHELLYNLLSEPEAVLGHCRTATAAIIMATVYSHNVQSASDPLVQLAETAVAQASSNLLPQTTLVNVFPSLRFLPGWLPGVKFQRLARECRKLTEDMQRLPWDSVRRNMAEGTQRQCVLSDLLEGNTVHGRVKDSEEDLRAVATTCYAAGVDTTLSQISTFFLSMTLNPHIQQRARAEIDSVVGTSRLPTFADRPHLPYIEAIYREVMRWRPVLPLALPHRASEDDWVDGYLIPKGSYVMSNLWAMSHDESVYPEPNVFKPERFFNADGTLNDDDTPLAFGLGRRICVGRHMASSAVWLTIASVLATFTLTKAKDAFGNDIEPVDDCTDGAISQPIPYKCCLTPRSEEVRSLIETARSESF
ncbi:cytochrome P450 [Pluteus cervinus]|uniref:Cytochrome P450 n=1 Tax=Pluteus cervinus TaxID=181527 RepID=A0ACD3AE73_9AGAR|nr:cytochrome P450 [Pluteus cervinus]